MNKLSRGWSLVVASLLITSVPASVATACTPNVVQSASTQSLITEKSIGPVRLGMTVARVRTVLPGLTLSRTSDGEGVALIAVERSNKTLLTLYAGETDPNSRISERGVVEFIEAWDASYRTSSGVHPKMSLRLVEQRYGKLKEIMLSEIESREFATFANQPAGIQLRVMNDNGMAGIYPDGQTKTTRYAPSAYVYSISIHARQKSTQENSSGSSRSFEDYPAEKFTGRPATPIIANQRARLYRTMIREDAQKGPNFAGHYTIARWGCGSTCVGFAVIDARDGTVYFHPKALQLMQVPYQAEDVLQFRPDSRLLIISGEILPIDPNSSSEPENTGKFYYEWKNNRFTLLQRGAIRREENAPPMYLETAETDAGSQTKLDDLCAHLENSYECAQAIERHQLKITENAQRVTRRGAQLRLKLSTGRWHTIRDYQKANDETLAVNYNFREYFPGIGYYLVHRQFYEGRDYLIIHEGNGRQFELQDLPVVSPDKQRLVTTSQGIIGGYSPNAVQIWRVTKNGLMLEQTIKPRDWEPSDALWIDNQTIHLKKNIPSADGSKMRTERVSLVLNRRWQIRS